ncbi:hypothetical protein A6F68_01098 [Tsuneonella dongtanensis]|uniref:NIPSNAP domain-containing protein n=1 Tax=Tsuneonella dongtanensis TaxID=692370 RepID=A0A1B2ABV3_9SPHN|nr:hypothetical protein [Tsuneonella dongtanensis]ANY19617.1 hypothetical protein A6F68_01098 [Tsuneonella dongtanensis]
MKKIASLVIASMAFLAVPASAQQSSYTQGTVWEASRVDVKDGQFENYMDYLAGQWKKVQEFAKAEGMVVDYHVLSTNNPRPGEPDLVLVVEYKDYVKTAESEAFRKKVNAMLAQSDRSADTAFANRQSMREMMGSTQYQELVLK